MLGDNGLMVVDRYEERYCQERQSFWEQAARQEGVRRSWGGYYHKRLAEVYRHLVPEGLRVVEFGCGNGDLLASLKPLEGLGIDFAPGMIERARQRHPQLRFLLADVHHLSISEQFDVVILSDLLNDVWDVQQVFEQAEKVLAPDGRVIVNSYSRFWELPLKLAQRLGFARPVLPGNWLTMEDLVNLENLSGFDVIRHWQEIILPLRAPLITSFFNKFVVKWWPFNHLGLTNFFISRPAPEKLTGVGAHSVSVVIPARNEAGNISAIFDRVPQMGSGTELVFVEGHSTDDTYAAIEAAITQHPEVRCKLLRQSGVGKGDAVRLGFANAIGDILMILDADLTVPPENLPRFYQALAEGKGDFVNGVRLVYPMEEQAMRFLNLLGNKFFTLAFSWLLGQPIKDTLCGTKVLWKRDYERIAANRVYFGEFDPFGDFDLIFGAVKLNRKIVDLPVRYRERKYGATNIQRWRHGWLLMKMLVVAALRIKFV